MQIQCVICSDLITSNALTDVVGLACGHIFHGLCIRTWLERSATCPHCRAKVTGSKQYKVFITIAPEPEGQDVITLTRTVDNLKYELKLKNLECSNLAKEVDTYKTRSSGLVKEVRKLEAEKASVAEISLQLNQQKKYVNIKARELSEAKFMIESLENELQQYQTLKAMVNNKSKETDSGIDIKSLDSSQLTFLLNTFKKDTLRLSKINENLKKTLSKCESEKISLLKRNEELQENTGLQEMVIKSLKQNLAKAKENEINQNKKRKERIGRDESKNSEGLNTTFSELPKLTVPKNGHDFDKTSQLNVEKENRPSEQCGPSKVMNSFHLSQPTFRITTDRKRCIGQINSSLRPSLSLDGLNYDGMGGHSKEDIFPSACRPKLISKSNKLSFKKRKI